MLIIREQIYVLGFLLVLSAFFSMSETALVGMSRLRILHLLEKKKRGAETLLALKEKPNDYLTAILIVNNLVNVGASVIATTVTIALFDNNALGIATGIMTLLILIFGEITPKSIASTHMDRTALFVAPPIALVTRVLAPLVWLFNSLTYVITRNAPDIPLITEDEIKTMVRLGHKEGELDADEKEMIQRIFKFDDMSVTEVMTPRSDIVAVKETDKIKELIQIMKKKSFSRIPVYKNKEDKITGVVFTKDLLKVTNKNHPVKKIMEKVSFVPSSQQLDTLLLQFKKKRQSIAMVVDEHGSLAGLVTMGDLLDEIVGEIVDEKEKVQPNVRKVGKNKWLVEGKADIEDVNIKIGSDFKDEEEYETISGFIIHKMEKIPKKDETIPVGKFLLTVDKVEHKRITKVRIEKK